MSIPNPTIKNQSIQWVDELAKTIPPQHLPQLLMNTIRDISRCFNLTEKQKMHSIRVIVEGFDAYQRRGA